MYKLVAVDIDDTLLNDENEVTPATKQAMAEAMARGVHITLATGRMFASAKNIARQLELNVPIITYQGSLVKNMLDETVLYERSVPQDAAIFLFDYCERNGLHLQAYYEDNLIVRAENEKIISYSRLSKIPYQAVDDFSSYAVLPNTKLLIIDEPETLDRIASELAPRIGDRVHITKSKPTFLEFTHLEGTKGHAVSFLAQHFGCSLDEVIAIGDSWNDREMLEVAGLGVAMANAVEPLKKIADFVTLSNNEDGVKHVLDKFVLSTGI